MAIAFFDLDRTLISVNSGQLWVRRELRLGHVTRWQATRAAAWIAGYHLGYSRIERVLEDAIATLAGVAEDEIAARTTRFYQEEVAGTARAGARRVLEEHRGRGDRLGPAHLGLDVLERARLRGAGPGRRPLQPLPGRVGTVHRQAGGRAVLRPGQARARARLRGVPGESLADAAFYTDSYSDRAVMEAVGRPVAVHPDQRLRRLAAERGWPVVAW